MAYQRFSDHASGATGPRPGVAATNHIELIQVRDKKQEVLEKLFEVSVKLGLIPDADFKNPEIVVISLINLETILNTVAEEEDSKAYAWSRDLMRESGRAHRLPPPYPRFTTHGLKMIIAKRKSESLVDYQKRMDAFIFNLTANKDPSELLWVIHQHQELSPPTDFQPDLSQILINNLQSILSRNEVEGDNYNGSELQLIASSGGDGSDRRMSILYDVLIQIEAIDSETYSSEAKSFEIRELLMKAMFDMSQTIPSFDYKQTPKLAKYAYQRKWLEQPIGLPTNKRSRELDAELQSLLRAYQLYSDYNPAELRATVYATGIGFEERLDILQAALEKIRANENIKITPGFSPKEYMDNQLLGAKDTLMRAMLTAGKTIPGFDITKTPKLNAYAAKQGWPEAVNTPKTIADDLAQFYTDNTDPKVLRSQTKIKYEQLYMTHSHDPQAVLLFEQVNTTYNKIIADVQRKHLNINEYAFKLVVLQAYAQYMNDTTFDGKSDPEKLAQAQVAFAQTLKTQASQFATTKKDGDPKQAGSEFNTNLATLAKIMAENMVALSQKARSRR